MQVQAGIPVELVDVLQATILFFLVVNPVIRRLLHIRNVRTGTGTPDTITRSYGTEAVP